MTPVNASAATPWDLEGLGGGRLCAQLAIDVHVEAGNNNPHSLRPWLVFWFTASQSICEKMEK
jgi:hypothetical protein